MRKLIIALLVLTFCVFSAEEIYKNDLTLGKNNNTSDKTFCFGNGNINRGCFKYDYANRKIRVSHDSDIYEDFSSPSDHNDLGGLQGGTTDQYYHVNSAQYASINNNASLSVLTGTDTNVIANGFTRIDTTGWVNNTNFKVSRGTTTLNLDGELVLSKDEGVNASGQYAHYDFVMPPKFRGSNILLFWYSAGVSGYADSYSRLEVWDTTTPTQKGIYYITNAKSAGYISFTALAASTNYQIRVYANNTTTSAFSLAISDVRVVDADSRFNNSAIRTLSVASGLYLGNASNNYPTGKVTYVNSGGLLLSDSDLSFDGKNLSVNGNAAIGTNDVSRAILTLGAGSGNANTAPIKFTYGTKMANPETGTVEFDGVFYETKNSNFRTAFTSIAFSQTSDKSVNNNTVENSVIDSGVGSTTIPANALSIGKTIRIKLRGVIGDTGNPSATIRVKMGSVTLIENTATLPTLSTESPFDFEYDIVTRSTGTTGTVYSVGRSFVTTATGPFMRGLDGGLDTINTTIDNLVDVTYQWSVADSSNNVIIKTASIEILY